MAKIALGMLFQNDEDILSQTIIKIPPLILDGMLFLDTGSKDRSEEIIRRNIPEAQIQINALPTRDFGLWRTQLLSWAESLGYDWMLFIDSDETLHEQDYIFIRQYAEKGLDDVYRFSRIDFVGDKYHYRHGIYPDWQGRLIRLNRGVYFHPELHAQAHKEKELITGVCIPHITIYHYGWTRDIYKKSLQYHNNDRQTQGLSHIEKFPEGQEVHIPKDWKLYPFLGIQP